MPGASAPRRRDFAAAADARRGLGRHARFRRGARADSEIEMIDRYTKIVLTVIAVALVALVAQQGIGGAEAQFGLALGCDGSPNAPCFIRIIN